MTRMGTEGQNNNQNSFDFKAACQQVGQEYNAFVASGRSKINKLRFISPGEGFTIDGPTADILEDGIILIDKPCPGVKFKIVVTHPYVGDLIEGSPTLRENILEDGIISIGKDLKKQFSLDEGKERLCLAVHFSIGQDGSLIRRNVIKNGPFVFNPIGIEFMKFTNKKAYNTVNFSEQIRTDEFYEQAYKKITNLCKQSYKIERSEKETDAEFFLRCCLSLSKVVVADIMAENGVNNFIYRRKNERGRVFFSEQPDSNITERLDRLADFGKPLNSLVSVVNSDVIYNELFKSSKVFMAKDLGTNFTGEQVHNFVQNINAKLQTFKTYEQVKQFLKGVGEERAYKQSDPKSFMSQRKQIEDLLAKSPLFKNNILLSEYITSGVNRNHILPAILLKVGSESFVEYKEKTKKLLDLITGLPEQVVNKMMFDVPDVISGFERVSFVNSRKGKLTYGHHYELIDFHNSSITSLKDAYKETKAEAAKEILQNVMFSKFIRQQELHKEYEIDGDSSKEVLPVADEATKLKYSNLRKGCEALEMLGKRKSNSQKVLDIVKKYEGSIVEQFIQKSVGSQVKGSYKITLRSDMFSGKEIVFAGSDYKQSDPGLSFDGLKEDLYGKLFEAIKNVGRSAGSRDRFQGAGGR